MPFKQKPLIWTCDPGTVAYNCARLGLPMPVLALPMWEGSGSKVYDYSGRGNHGSITNATWDRNGLLLNADGKHVLIDTANGFSTTYGTVFLIYREVATPDGNGAFFEGSSEGFNFRLGRHWNDTIINFYVNSVACSFDSLPNVFDNDEHSIAIAFDTVNDSQSLYIDGILHKTRGDTIDALDWGADKIRIGSVSTHSVGLQSVFIKWPTVLSAIQIQALNNNPYGLFEPVPRAKFWYVASGGETIELSGTSAITSQTSEAVLKIARSISGTAAISSSTADAILGLLLAISGTSAITSATSSPVLSVLRNLSGTNSAGTIRHSCAGYCLDRCSFISPTGVIGNSQH